MTDVAFEELGEGEPVLVLPGFPFGAHAFRWLTPMLATRFRTIVVDPTSLAGTAAKDAGRRCGASSWSVCASAASLVAHGTGGGVAQLLAFGGADVDAMVLLDSVAFDAWPAASRRPRGRAGPGPRRGSRPGRRRGVPGRRGRTIPRRTCAAAPRSPATG